jgi:N6-adenosine-specific RNA methylase IME4
MIPFPDKKYEIIYCDPPWSYPLSGGKTSARGLAKQHYDLMKFDELCQLPVREISTDNAICFMWTTFPKIDEAVLVMQSWGFVYKTAAFVWVKKNKKSLTNFWGMGAYTRANVEVCLLGVSKGTKAKQQVINNAVHQVIESPIERHSKKPDIARDKIIELLGDRPRIELFARQQSEGWDVWGNEV